MYFYFILKSENLIRYNTSKWDVINLIRNQITLCVQSIKSSAQLKLNVEQAGEKYVQHLFVSPSFIQTNRKCKSAALMTESYIYICLEMDEVETC